MITARSGSRPVTWRGCRIVHRLSHCHRRRAIGLTWSVGVACTCASRSIMGPPATSITDDRRKYTANRKGMDGCRPAGLHESACERKLQSIKTHSLSVSYFYYSCRIQLRKHGLRRAVANWLVKTLRLRFLFINWHCLLLHRPTAFCFRL